MIKNILKTFIWMAILLSATLLNATEPASIREQDIVIPTYRIGEPDRNPLFYDGRIYQGAQGKVYPYPMLDVLTDDRVDKTYKAVYLENEYLELSLLPEIGGRLFSALDKTNGHDFIYRQSVIKPALIGMLGAWISGGVEWNIPHHHRASTYMPVDYTLQDNPDGSKTVWVGELELRHRMRWAIGITVFPGKSYFKATVKLFNRTPLANSVMYWANLSVHANEDYQVFFPPSTRYATDHNKIEFTEWPVSRSIYRGVDFRDGMDLSWWKNHPRQTSAFAWNYRDDFISGYDHGKQAGICHVANHHTVPGKKFFEWGNGPVGRMWDKVLTDSDGPYLEIMTGAWSDNQPDYSWSQPYETRIIEQYWYPLRKMGGAKKANLQAAVNLEITDQGKLFAGFNTTAEYIGCKVLVQCDGKVLLEQTVTLSPDRPFTAEIPLPAGADYEQCRATLRTADGLELISYQQEKLPDTPKPDPVQTPAPPAEVKTGEELYLTGMRLEQFHNPVLDPDPYYQEALRRDPGDYRANTALGILYLKRHMFIEAETLLRRAVERGARQHTMPRDGEAFYYLGRALKLQGKTEEASDYYNKAAWSRTFQCPAFYELAEIECAGGNYDAALEMLENSLANNMRGTEALNLKTAILRLRGAQSAAEKTARRVLELDPLNFRAGYELGLLGGQVGGGQHHRRVGNDVQVWLELAVAYANAGLPGEGITALETWLGSLDSGEQGAHPLVYYWLGYLYSVQGELERAGQYSRLAARANPDYCFPFRSESIRVLRHAAAGNPDDARCRYYLGNLLYDHQPEVAIEQWELARKLDSSFWTVHRNLGYAYFQYENEVEKSIASYRRALELNKTEPRLFFELDVASAVGNVDPRQRLALLEDNHQTLLARYDAVSREAILMVLLGEYDRAIELMTNYHFHKWEGFGVIHNVYVDAYLLRGRGKYDRGDYAGALEDYLQALEFPLNLEVGKPYRDEGSWRVNYFAGTAFEALGNNSKAHEYYQAAVPDSAAPGEVLYCQALAFHKLGEADKARQVFQRLIDAGQARLNIGKQSSVFAKFGERQARNIIDSEAHLMLGLGHLGLGERNQARRNLETALKLNVSNLAAKTALAGI